MLLSFFQILFYCHVFPFLFSIFSPLSPHPYPFSPHFLFLLVSSVCSYTPAAAVDPLRRCGPAPPPRLRRWCHLLLFGILCGLHQPCHLLRGLVGATLQPPAAPPPPWPVEPAGHLLRGSPAAAKSQEEREWGRERGCVRFVIWVAAIWV
jgi:hypothetical protein